MRQRQRNFFSGLPRNRLTRDSEDRVLFGVCSGLADYFGFDVKLTRIVVACGAVFFFPTVIVLYIILGLLLDETPHAPHDRKGEEYKLRQRVRSEPHTTLGSVRHRFRDLDRRLQRLEKHVTSKRFDLERELDGLGD